MVLGNLPSSKQQGNFTDISLFGRYLVKMKSCNVLAVFWPSTLQSIFFLGSTDVMILSLKILRTIVNELWYF